MGHIPSALSRLAWHFLRQGGADNVCFTIFCCAEKSITARLTRSTIQKCLVYMCFAASINTCATTVLEHVQLFQQLQYFSLHLLHKLLEWPDLLCM